MDEIWVEKYRPQKLAEVVGQKTTTSRLSNYVKEKSMPHLMFSGPAGTGKTSSAIALAKELFEENWRYNVHELNASDERGIDVVRGKIKEFARTAPLGEEGFKIIFLDEADALTSAAQAALRRTMEKYSRTCRFILSCNYSSKIIDPIQSRCAVFRFRPVKEDEMRKYLKYVSGKENIKITDDGLDAVVYLAQGDMRRGINNLQMAAASGEKSIDSDIIYQAVSAARPDEVRGALEFAIAGKFSKARECLDKLQITYGLAGEDIVRQMHRTIREMDVPDDTKIGLISALAETDFRIGEGANAWIQIEAAIAQFVNAGKTLDRELEK